MLNSKWRQRHALNLESDNVGVVIFGDDRAIRKAIWLSVRRNCRSAVGKGLLGRVEMLLAIPSTAKAR